MTTFKRFFFSIDRTFPSESSSVRVFHKVQLQLCQLSAKPYSQLLSQLLLYIAVIKNGPYQCQPLQARKLGAETTHKIARIHQLVEIVRFSLKRSFQIAKFFEKLAVVDHRQRDHSRQNRPPQAFLL